MKQNFGPPLRKIKLTVCIECTLCIVFFNIKTICTLRLFQQTVSFERTLEIIITIFPDLTFALEIFSLNLQSANSICKFVKHLQRLVFIISRYKYKYKYKYK